MSNYERKGHLTHFFGSTWTKSCWMRLTPKFLIISIDIQFCFIANVVKKIVGGKWRKGRRDIQAEKTNWAVGGNSIIYYKQENEVVRFFNAIYGTLVTKQRMHFKGTRVEIGKLVRRQLKQFRWGVVKLQLRTMD